MVKSGWKTSEVIQELGRRLISQMERLTVRDHKWTNRFEELFRKLAIEKRPNQ